MSWLPISPDSDLVGPAGSAASCLGRGLGAGRGLGDGYGLGGRGGRMMCGLVPAAPGTVGSGMMMAIVSVS